MMLTHLLCQSRYITSHHKPNLLPGSQAGQARRGKLLVRLIEARNLTFHTGMMSAFHTLVRLWLAFPQSAVNLITNTKPGEGCNLTC